MQPADSVTRLTDTLSVHLVDIVVVVVVVYLLDTHVFTKYVRY